MSTSGNTKESWGKEKEELKKQFEAITDKYILFDETDEHAMSERLQERLAKTKAELHNIIEAM